LRTLVLGVKNVDENFYNRWSESYKQIRLQPSNPNKQKALDQMHNQIETDITLLGATAIEDKLQQGVPQAINDFRKAGIKVWMLTGDKKETAENIGISCKLIGPNSKKFYLDGTNQNVI